MKVYFCNSFLESCYFVRCLIPMQALGADGDRTSLRGNRIEPHRQTQAVLDADIVVFHRPNDWRSLEIAKKLRAQGKKIVADNDDSYKNLDGKNLQKALEKVDKGLDEFCKFADLVTCSTEMLAKEYRKLNENVVVLRNCFDKDYFPEQPQKNEGNKVRLGFIGSVASNGDYNEIKDILKELSNRDDIQLVVFALPPLKTDTTEGFVVREMYAADYNFWKSLKIEWQHFVPVEDYINTLDDLKIDICVIPRKNGYFNRAKSNLKFIEMSALGIPCIGQGFSTGDSPYQIDPDDGKYMDIVIDNKDWMKYLEPLIQSKELRRERGQKAREYVLGKYEIQNNIWRWQNAYEDLLK